MPKIEPAPGAHTVGPADGGQAFPRTWTESWGGVAANASNDGMSLRDYYAGQVIAGFCANPAIFAANDMCGWGLVNSTGFSLGRYAFEIADDMLAARAASPARAVNEEGGRG